VVATLFIHYAGLDLVFSIRFISGNCPTELNGFSQTILIFENICMTTITEIINGRKIFYLDISNDLEIFKSYAFGNWVLLVILDNPADLPERFADICIDKDVLYVCAAGDAGRRVAKVFSFNMVDRELAGKGLPSWYQSEDDVLMTSWDEDISEALFSATFAANYGEISIENVVVVNLTTDNYFPTIQQLAKQLNDGMIPGN